MRGSPKARRIVDEHVGIIPAHAGLTKPDVWSSDHAQDHPRACGAHLLAAPRTVRERGSSPRMRGSPLHFSKRHSPPGIIPAHAGLTATRLLSKRSARDHPRACGAHARSSMRSSHRRGSSPRMRGSPLLQIGSQGRKGIIPAHAGLTVVKPLTSSATRDHPRACGAHVFLPLVSTSQKGSSPRMRGSRIRACQ